MKAERKLVEGVNTRSIILSDLPPYRNLNLPKTQVINVQYARRSNAGDGALIDNIVIPGLIKAVNEHERLKKALDDIAVLFDNNEWDADTCNDVAEILGWVGYEIRDPYVRAATHGTTDPVTHNPE